MANWKLKSCPKCGGDLLVEKDMLYGWHETCFQCSFSRALKEAVVTEKKLDSANKVRVTNTSR